ncbi:MAG TPA: M24 family metallopeptidase [Candidatus Binataceae bacterium]|nr:M24 family metallopeptidase [Candidatus Binataceae bacterium]
MERLGQIARAVKDAGIDGWLFYDFRLSDPLAYRVLGLPETGLSTRRWFFLVGADGGTQALVSAVEANRLDALPAGRRIVYRSEREMIAGVRSLLGGCRRIAMNYSPACAIPYVSRVDGGTLELVRACGVEVVTAADLIQLFEAVLTPAQLAGHRRAAERLRLIVDETFTEIVRRIRGKIACSEYAIQRFVLERVERHGMRTDEAPIVAVNAHAANPHFSPIETPDTPIAEGDLVLIDLFAKELAPDSIYGDLTWMGYVGASVPAEYAAVFAIVARARDAAVALIQERLAARRRVSGAEADRAAREVIEEAGYGDNFVHRTGHSIGREVHGTGANLDSLETRDERALIEGACFSVEPGIYLPGRFGIRSEIDMFIEGGRAEVSGGAPQTAIIPIVSRYGGA